jgi:hypothetical protein
MQSKPISEAVRKNFLQTIQLIATDMDGTLTQGGKFSADLFRALDALAAVEIPVIIVTGRSAGWVSGLTTYLPIRGAIAENGGLYFARDLDLPVTLSPIPDPDSHRQRLAATFESLKSEFPQLRESADNRYRITDWTFDVEGLSAETLNQLEQRCNQQGWGFTYSSVQCHIKLPQQEKSAGLGQVLRDYFPDCRSDRVLTVGDSPNDQSLFAREIFPHSVGVANVLDYRDRLLHQPAYVTDGAEGEGFCQLAKLLVEARKTTKNPAS